MKRCTNTSVLSVYALLILVPPFSFSLWSFSSLRSSPAKANFLWTLRSRKLNGGQEGRRLHVRERSRVDPITQEPDRLKSYRYI